MRCPYCGVGDDRVVDSRESREGAVIRRRRECNACQRRFTSYETVEEIPLLVVKKDGRREPFDRNKLLRGLMKACEKRPVETKTLEAICDEIEAGLSAKEPREMTTVELGAEIMEKLKELDQVAYVRFASVYRRFEDLGDFVDELKVLLGRVPGPGRTKGGNRKDPSRFSSEERPPCHPTARCSRRRWTSSRTRTAGGSFSRFPAPIRTRSPWTSRAAR